MMGNLYGSLWQTVVIQVTKLPAPPSPDAIYNERQYHDRGWCVFEDGVARLADFHRVTRCRADRQAKLIDISGSQPQPYSYWRDSFPPDVYKSMYDQPSDNRHQLDDWFIVQRQQELAPTVENLTKAIQRATFTGKADEQVVVKMISEFNDVLEYGAEAKDGRLGRHAWVMQHERRPDLKASPDDPLEESRKEGVTEGAVEVSELSMVTQKRREELYRRAKAREERKERKYEKRLQRELKRDLSPSMRADVLKMIGADAPAAAVSESGSSSAVRVTQLL